MKLSLAQISKTYKNGVKALDDITIDIDAGMFGLLGPNGAGKSTLMRTIATLQAPDTGSAIFNDIDILTEKTRLREVLGYLPQSFGVYPKVSAEDLLIYFAKLKGIKSKNDIQEMVNTALEVTNLLDVRNKHVAGYSGGMKQRFGIAQLLLNNPKLIIVDEPTAGLDPAERHRFLNVLREIGTNHIVIFSTHIVDDVKELCTDMAIMNGGRILSHITPREATKSLEGQIWTKNIIRDELDAHEASFNVISSNFNDDNTLNIRVHDSNQPDDTFSLKNPELEDFYFVMLRNDEPALIKEN